MAIPTKLRKKYPAKSEFGKGFIICLIKFSEHVEHLGRLIETCKEIGSPTSRANATWFYNASDHLLNLECPGKFKGTKIEELVNELRRWLHKRSKHELSDDEVITITDLVREIAILVDKELEIEADIGKF